MGRTRLRHWRQLELDAYELLAELLEQHCKDREASGQESLRHLQQASYNAWTCTVPVVAEVLEQQRVAQTKKWRCPGSIVQQGLGAARTQRLGHLQQVVVCVMLVMPEVLERHNDRDGLQGVWKL